MTRGRSTLALFGSRLVSSEDKRATDITLDGYDPVLPSVAKITLIAPRGVLKESPSETPSWLVPPDR